MRNILFALLWCVSLFAQHPFSAPLPVSGAHSLGITSSGKLWIVTKPGDTFYSESIDSLWHYGTIRKNDEISGGIFEEASFFDDKKGVISGYIQGKEYDTQFVYRTVDSGKTWSKVVFGKESWIDAVWVTTGGKAWMSGSSQLIYYSDDFGASWKEFGKVEKNSNLRFSTIHFTEDASIGMFGTFGNNKIYKTTDNCKHWDQVPTPYAQGKYKKLSKSIRPEINKIRITPDKKYYMVNQQGHIFYTVASEINWTLLPDVIDFEIAENGQIYVVNKDFTVSVLDANLKQEFTSVEKFKSSPYSLKVKNNCLYALSQGYVYKINKEHFIAKEMFTDEVPIPHPDIFVDDKDGVVGFSKNRVLLYDDVLKQWHCYMELPFFVGAASQKDDKILLTSYTGEHFLYDLKSRSTKEYTMPETIINVSGKVASLKFEIGSRGCFHNSVKFVLYKVSGDNLMLAEEKELEGFPESIPLAKVDQFIVEINKSVKQKPNISDFGFSESDYKKFLDFINQSERNFAKGKQNNTSEGMALPGENVDFGFYRNYIKEMPNLSSDKLDEIFKSPSYIWSTTTNWKKVEVAFNDGTTLILQNDNYSKGYYCLPWYTSYKGLMFSCNSIKAGAVIDNITEGRFFDKSEKNKVRAMLEIVNYIFLEKFDNGIGKF